MNGNITVVEPKERFKRVSLDAIRNENIDLFTLGLYVRILVRGKDWNLNINGLASIFKVGDEKIRKAVKLLENEGYIRREPVRDEVTGKLNGWNYFIYADAVPENERTAIGKNRITVKPPLRENRITENGEGTIILDTTNRLESTNRKDNNNSKFDFKKAVLDLGVPEEIVNDWLQVRKDKKASNTRTAFDRIKAEIEKSGQSPTECIRMCAENSWQGFKAEWLQHAKTPPPTPSPKKEESLSDYYRKLMAELNINPNAIFRDTPDEQ